MAGRRGGRLLPRSVPAGGRTPLGDRSAASRRDRPTAPAAGRRRSPPFATADFDGDGHLDLIWQNANTGERTVQITVFSADDQVRKLHGDDSGDVPADDRTAVLVRI